MAEKNVYSSKVTDKIKFIEPSLLKDKLVSENIKRFIMDNPLTRLTVLGLVLYASRQLKNGMTLLDVGAGDSPYKSLFTHVIYKSVDSGETGHDYKEIDYFCSADKIPVSEKSFDAILCTEVFEHLPDPKSVLVEFNRVLQNNGHLFLTTRFVHPLHEEPYDFFRYTSYSFEYLLKETGFEVVFITSMGGWFATIASTLRKYVSLRSPIRHPRNVKGLLLYCFLILPLISLPVVALRLLPLKVLSWLDKTLDMKQKFTPGFALHAIKMKEV